MQGRMQGIGLLAQRINLRVDSVDEMLNLVLHALKL